MFRQQLRAILRASAFGKVRLLMPMVAHLSEIRQHARSAGPGQAAARRRRPAYGDVELGAMIEVPAAALMLPAFLRHFDFVSIGTNDLIQYTLAIDRADEAVAHLYDPWHPAVLQLVAQTIARRDAPRQGRQRLRRDGGRPGVHRTAAGAWACAASRCTRRRSRRSSSASCATEHARWAAALAARPRRRRSGARMRRSLASVSRASAVRKRQLVRSGSAAAL